MFNLKIAVKTALSKKGRTMTSVAKAIGKDRAALTSSLYNGNTVINTIESVSIELGYELSDFIKLGED